jgi:hypothetical protein
VTRPDLIELSADWDSALLVADRYTGIGSSRNDDKYFVEQGKQILAAVLFLANKQGLGYEWVHETLGGMNYEQIRDLTEHLRNESSFYVYPVAHVENVLGRREPERSAIFSSAYVMFKKALQPGSAMDRLARPHVGQISKASSLPPKVTATSTKDRRPSSWAVRWAR